MFDLYVPESTCNRFLRRDLALPCSDCGRFTYDRNKSLPMCDSCYADYLGTCAEDI